MLNSRNKDRYDGIVRFCSIGASVLMLWISAMFSAAGFSFDQPDKEWIGYALAGIIIIVEIVWNKKGAKHGVTLYVGGLACYIYGLYTNVLGILISQEASPEGVGFALIGSFISMAVTHPVALLGGVLLELLPEPLLIWALTGESIESDPLAHAMDFSAGVESKTETHKESMYGRVKSGLPKSYLPTTQYRPSTASGTRPQERQTTFIQPTEPAHHPQSGYQSDDENGE